MFTGTTTAAMASLDSVEKIVAVSDLLLNPLPAFCLRIPLMSL